MLAQFLGDTGMREEHHRDVDRREDDHADGYALAPEPEHVEPTAVMEGWMEQEVRVFNSLREYSIGRNIPLTAK